MYFLKDLIDGKKKCKDILESLTPFAVIKCDQVKVIFVPQYESLSMERVLDKAREWPEVWQYMPDDRDIHRLPKGWCCSLIFTVVGGEFQAWVDEQIKMRNDKLAEETNKMISVEPSIAALFGESQNISSKCARGHRLLEVG